MQKQLNIVLFGPPGAGKGTQSERIINRYHLTHISTGDLFRKHLGEGTELGLKAKKFINNGKLVPDEIVIGMVEDKINTTVNTNGFIFDGFPRTVHQAKVLDQLLVSDNGSISVMILLDVGEDELKTRLRSRAKISGRADDQDEVKIQTRINEYREKTLPVAGYYNKQDKLISIDGLGSIDEISRKICEVLDPLNELA
jgi:adenylate kinase